MKDWIQQNINPPGMEKKNRGSLFSFIGRVFTIVKNDAETAFKAFFPYLCDPQKLREHGRSLSIPELPYDSEQEYRERVSTASFYLMRAGERTYIHEQLRAHFGEAFLIKEEFLRIFIKILDVRDEDIKWALHFFDSILDPNIVFTIGEWFHYVETVLLSELADTAVRRNDTDSFNRIQYNGLIKYDRRTINKTVTVRGRYDGGFTHVGTLRYNGFGLREPSSKPHPPFKYSSGIVDRLSMDTVMNVFDNADVFDCFEAALRKKHGFAGSYRYDGAIQYDSGIIIPV